MTPIAPHITAFLRQRLPVERRASQHTTDAYAYAFTLLFEFTSARFGVRPSEIALEQIDAPLVLDFLAHLQSERRSSSRTRNARLAAIKSFMRFVEHRAPAALEQTRRVLAIPAQRTDTALVPHLNMAEVKAILDAPDPTTRMGIRDRALLYVGFAGGLRVSELVGLRLAEISFEGRYVEVVVRGKGRRQRALLLWKEPADALRAWLAVRGDGIVPELFFNAGGQALTRSGFEHILRKHVSTASASCPSLTSRRVSPHVLRHTCAMNTLRATGDIRKVALWLGHANQRTTEIYLQGDTTEKLAALEAMTLPSLRPGTFRPPDRLIAALHGNPEPGGSLARRTPRRQPLAPTPPCAR